jgi:hypothetical protein
MDGARLIQLGLKLRTDGPNTLAEMTLDEVGLVNPLTRRPIRGVTFAVTDDGLVALDPLELAGLTPVPVTSVANGRELQSLVNAAFTEYVLHLQRLSGMLQNMGLTPQVDPDSLHLTAEVAGAGHHFQVGADKQGNLRVLSAQRGEESLDVSAGHGFDLAEFKEKAALVGYLVALFGGELSADQASPRGAEGELSNLLTYAELAYRFGSARVPPHSAVDILVVMEARGAHYRFAAARVAGRSFRGLLAGVSGKLWAERFELDEFPGPRALLAYVLEIPQEEVHILGEEPGGGP